MGEHEPECWYVTREGQPDRICICESLLKAYRRGYNDHARTVQHWQDTHGAYRQHGEGENP